MTSLYISPDKPSQPSMGNTERIWKHMCSTVSVYDIAGDKVLNLSCPRHGHICVGRRTSPVSLQSSSQKSAGGQPNGGNLGHRYAER